MRPISIVLSSVLALILFASCTQRAEIAVGTDAESSESTVHAIVDVTVLPMSSADRLEHRTVLLRNGLVEQIGQIGSVDVPRSAIVVDGRGRYLLPGLADMHAHPMRANDLALYLANGVTLVRAMWGEPSLLGLREAVNRGDIPGPRIYAAGRIVGGAVPHHFGTVALADPADAEAVVDGQLASGFDFVKIYSGLSREAFDAIAAAAEASDMEFSGHVPRVVPLADAVGSSMRTMEHLYGFLSAVKSDDVGADFEWRFADREAAKVVGALGRGEKTITDLFDSEKYRAIVDRVAADEVWIVPTLSVLKMHRFDAVPDTARYLHPSVSAMWSSMIPLMTQLPDDNREGEDRLFEYQLALVGDLYRAGANLLVGTDAPNPGVVTGYAVAEEIQLLERSGLSRMDALAAATRGPAEYMGEQDHRGTVIEGAVADLLLLDRDPTANLDALREIAGVFRAIGYDGSLQTRWYPRAELDAMLEGVEQDARRLREKLDAEPTLIDDAIPVYSFEDADGQRFAMQVRTREDTLDVVAAVGEVSSSRWQRIEIHHTPGQMRLTSGETVYATSDDGTSLLRDGEIVAASGAKPITMILTQTPADLPVLDRALNGLAAGETMSLSAWLCPQPTDCSAAPVTNWQIQRIDDSVVDGPFYYTGVRVYAVSVDGNASGNLYIGGGSFYNGQPLQVDIEGWITRDLRRLR